MRRALLITAALMAVVCMAGTAVADIDWAGNVWPNHGHNVTPTGPVDVYAQVWKEGVTDLPGLEIPLVAVSADAEVDDGS